ncbi:MAG: hypothetical protein E5X74_12370 [Mesorhizobium sp.]|uniref:hypothetical protein n=1 Tax=Mesorhizobium sp. TaxID=1871066 RepID=UPI0011F4EFDB|nr:hypothetical protein [Mesorhizobium sp.]TIO79629.1 MAG: hypothetical protein E5X75_03600 [Mesorhizobium sp.]TIO85433.1 MAG: hypothetical protein E5X74_12370 [Mesorhizobium sp.]
MSTIGAIYRRTPASVAIVWLALSAVLSLLLLQGKMPNGDVDDLMKLHEIRHLLQTGNPFDRTLTGIAQPEPMVSHWPWIVDAPYALVATAIAPFVGMEAAVSVAAFTVPLLLLLVAMTLLFLLIREFEFEHPGAVLAVAAFAGLPAFSEFQPWRIDYHNLQMLILLGAALLTIRGGRVAAGLNGALMALSTAISAEMAPFLVLPVGFYALAFVAGKSDAGKDLRAYGLALAAAGIAMFFVVVGPRTYTSAACDRYSLLHLTALAVTGVALAGISTAGTVGSWPIRAACLLVAACATAALLVFFFPRCAGGPLVGMSDYVRDNWLLRIDQERSIFYSADFISSDRFTRFFLAILGTAATCILAISGTTRKRAWVVLAVFSTAGLLLGLLYLRYLRFFPLFVGPGTALLIHQGLPAWLPLRRCFGTRSGNGLPGVWLLAAPGAAIVAALFAGHLVWPPQLTKPIGIDIADACEKADAGPHFVWPKGARLFAPAGIEVAALGSPADLEVVAVPFHTSVKGIERVLRFFDPATPDPARLLDETKATHVAVCRVEEETLKPIEAQFPLASRLATGRPPDWLTECPVAGPLRIYRYPAAGGPSGQCPVAGQ